jgi:hypothetical protein
MRDQSSRPRAPQWADRSTLRRPTTGRQSRARLGPRPRARGPPAHGASSPPSRRGRTPSSATMTTRPIGRRAVPVARQGSPRKHAAASGMQEYDVRPARALEDRLFSGGNQQKIVLAREIERDPDVLLVGQPTRGVDIGAIEFIHNQPHQDARCRQGHPARLGRARRDPLARRPHPRHVRRPDHRRRSAIPTATEGELGLLMAGVTDANGNTSTGGGQAE